MLHSDENEELFCETLQNIRMVLLQPSYFPAILSPKIVETLGYTYDFDPRLFGRMLEARPG
jgi:hypothetical protein